MTLIQKSNFMAQGMFFQQLYWEKNQNKTHFNEDISDPPLSPLEMFQKFIRFGDAIRP